MLVFVCVCAYLYQDTIELLQARISALDSATLDQVEARLQVTNCNVQRVIREKGETLNSNICNVLFVFLF